MRELQTNGKRLDEVPSRCHGDVVTAVSVVFRSYVFAF